MEKAVSNWYDASYEKVNLTGRPNSFSARKIHSLIEIGRPGGNFTKCLEVGSNNLSHLPFIRHTWDEYYLVDLRPKAKGDDNAEKIFPGVSFCQSDVHHLPFEDNKFDRVISTCLFHHLDNPLNAMRELKRVIKPGGVIDLFLPCDPGLLYRTIRFLTTGLNAKKHGLSLESRYMNAIEHRNHIKSLVLMFEYIYGPENLKVEWFPLKFASWNLNLSCVIRIDNIKMVEE